MKTLNKSELELIRYLWEIEKGFLKDIVQQYPEPRPAYTTIATLLTRMCKKKYVGFNRLGRDKQYYPLLQKNSYFTGQLKNMVHQFFNDSATQFASFFTKSTDMTVEELNELQKIIDQQIADKTDKK